MQLGDALLRCLPVSPHASFDSSSLLDKATESLAVFFAFEPTLAVIRASVCSSRELLASFPFDFLLELPSPLSVGQLKQARMQLDAATGRQGVRGQADEEVMELRRRLQQAEQNEQAYQIR